MGALCEGWFIDVIFPPFPALEGQGFAAELATANPL